MADVIHHYDTDESVGSGTALGVILGILLVLALLLGGWWLFFRQPVANRAPNTTIIKENQPPANSNTNIQEGDTGGTATTTP